jgi:hypothetical protein
MSKYACTPSNAEPFGTPSGFVFDATPLTRISVAVTPGWSTVGNRPVDTCPVDGTPSVSCVAAELEPPDVALEHAATSVATMTNEANLARRACIADLPDRVSHNVCDLTGSRRAFVLTLP